jgi:hypothetical protein
MTVCSDLLSELPANHEKTGTLAHRYKGSVNRKRQLRLILQSNVPRGIQESKYHIPNKLALRGCECTTASISLSFPFPFPLLLESPKDEGE